MEPLIIFDVSNQSIERMDEFKIVAKSRNYLRAKFNFLTPEWNDVFKIALFIDKDKDPIHMCLDEDDTCDVPWEWLLTPGLKKVTVFGGDRITTDVTLCMIYKSGYEDSSEASGEPTPDAFTHIFKSINELNDNKVNSNMGENNAGKVLVVDSDGNVVPREAQNNVEAITTDEILDIVNSIT